MKIETIRLKNFKAFENVELFDIPPFCIVVGANGTGKSTLLKRIMGTLEGEQYALAQNAW